MGASKAVYKDYRAGNPAKPFPTIIVRSFESSRGEGFNRRGFAFIDDEEYVRDVFADGRLDGSKFFREGKLVKGIGDRVIGAKYERKTFLTGEVQYSVPDINIREYDVKPTYVAVFATRPIRPTMRPPPVTPESIVKLLTLFRVPREGYVVNWEDETHNRIILRCNCPEIVTRMMSHIDVGNQVFPLFEQLGIDGFPVRR